MDEHSQADANYDHVEAGSSKRKGGRRGGDRAAQQRRYRARWPGKYRAYMRRYMAERRKSVKQNGAV